MTFAGSYIWNKMPEEIGMAQTLQCFKEHLRKHLAAQQAHTVSMTHWCTLLAGVGGTLEVPVLCGGRSHR